MEELLLDFSAEELEAIEKINVAEKFKFPVIYFGKAASFNGSAVDSGIVPNYINWFVSTDYVIGLPADSKDKKAFKTHKSTTGSKSIVGAFPARLRDEKKLKPGYYKLLKYKNGFAFKRYEPIDENN